MITRFKERFDYLITTLMFFLALLVLLLVALIWRYMHTETVFERLPYVYFIVELLLLLWPLFFLESLIQLVVYQQRQWQRVMVIMAIMIFPPLRLILKRGQHYRHCSLKSTQETYQAHWFFWQRGSEYFGSEQLWWFFQWRLIHPDFLQSLEKQFSTPIFLLAMLLLPLWLLQQFWPPIMVYPLFYHGTQLLQALITFLFSVELLLFIALSHQSWNYLARNWLELFIFWQPILGLVRLIKAFNLNDLYQDIETSMNRIMFLLTLFFLGIVAVLVQYLQIEQPLVIHEHLDHLSYFNRLVLMADRDLAHLPYNEILISILLALWSLLIIERVLYLIFCQYKTWKSFFACLVIMLLPPLRLTSRRCHQQHYIWFFDWHLITPNLYHWLEKTFLFPILIISFFMMPFWITGIFFHDKLITYPILYHIHHLGNALIWGLFVCEFIIMISLATRTKDYLVKHWLELLIILLPLFALARLFVVAQYATFYKQVYVIKLAKLQKMLNIYRARSVIHRLFRILVIIDLFKRFYQPRKPEKYLKILQQKLDEKEKEIIELKNKIQETEILIKQKKECQDKRD